MSDTINAMRTGIIYGYTNLESGRMYIGQTIYPKRRWRQHRYSKRKNGWHKDYQNNPDKYEYSVIEYDVPEDKLDECEIFWISFFDSYHNGYNLTPGGSVSSGFKDKHHSYKSKQKMSEARKGDKNPFYGRHHSEETKQKLSIKNGNPSLERRQKMSEHHADVSGENNPFYGRHHSEETKQKMSEARKGDKNPFYGKCGENHPNFGKRFYTDGNKNIVAYECPEGFRPGKTIFKNKKCT